VKIVTDPSPRLSFLVLFFASFCENDPLIEEDGLGFFFY